MTANYFMLTRDGEDLSGLDFPPFTDGAGPTTVDVSDAPDARELLRTNLIPNPSFEVDLTGWEFLSSGLPTRTTAESYVGSACMEWTRAGIRNIRTDYLPASPGKTYTASLHMKAAESDIYNVDVYLSFFNASGSSLGSTYTEATMSTAWQRFSHTATAPAGTATMYVLVVAYGGASAETYFYDAVLLEEAATPSTYFDGDSTDAGALSYDWSGAPHASPSIETTPFDDVPSDLDGVPMLWLDQDDDAPYRPAEQTMPWPTGFYRSVFRVVRDPAVVGDDSGDALADQVYNHGWLITERLAWMLVDLHTGHVPHYGWPLDEDFDVIPVTGTPDTNSGSGWYGLTQVTWPGSGAGVGTMRQLIAGSEGSTRKVAAILDLLAATTGTQRTTMGNEYSANQSSIRAAYDNLMLAAGQWQAQGENWPYDSASSAQNKYTGRATLNAFLGRAAVGLALQDSSNLGNAVGFGLMAITAKEAGLIGATFTEASYQAMTGPIDAVLAMPSGY